MATYYTSPAGNDGNSGSLAAPKRTIVAGIALLSAGDTLLIRAGTYDEGISSCPSGTSWANPVRVANYPGETVWLTPLSHLVGNPGECLRFQSSSPHYIEFDGIHMDGTHMGYGTVGFVIDSTGEPHHIRVQHAEIIGRTTDNSSQSAWGAQVVEIHGGLPVIQGGFEFRYLTIHGGGRPGTTNYDNGYGIYISAPNNLVEFCDLSDNKGANIQVYNDDGEAPNTNIIRNNRFHANTRTGSAPSGIAILISGSGNQFYNNIIDGSTWTGGSGIDLYNASGTKIWNNTIYNNIGNGITINSGSSNTEVRNNIIYLNSGTAIADSSASTTQDHNLTTNPLFVNPGAADYRLQSISPAINAGTSVPVTTDYIGTVRPQSTGYDIGAYEYLSTIPTTAQTYYVAKTGLDTNSGSSVAPKLTITAGLALLQAGDTLVIRAGIYAEAIRNTVITGVDWTSPTRVMANPGDLVWLTPAADEYAVYLDRDVHHLEFTGIHIDAIHCTLGAIRLNAGPGGNPHHVRFQDAEIIGNPAFGHTIHAAASSAGLTGANEFLRLTIHGGGGSEADEGIRLESADNLVSGCELSDLPGNAIHVVAAGDSPDDTILTANRIHDLRATSAGQAHRGIYLANGANPVVTNNVIWNVPDDGGPSIGMNASGGSAAAIYNNTVTACGEGIAIEAGHSGALVKNNIAYLNTANDYRDDGGSFAEGTRVAGGETTSDSTIAATAFVATAGNLLVAAFWADDATAASVADTAVNTWHAAGTAGQWALFYAYNITGHAANVVTATLSGASTSRAFCVRQFSGVPTTDPKLDADGATDTNTAPTTPVLTIAQPAVVVEFAFANAGGLTDAGPFTMNSFVIPSDPYFGSSGYFADAVAVTSVDATPQANCSYGFWMLAAAAFATSGVGATTATNLFGSDPSFVNAASGNFRLLSGSAAQDAGTTLASVPVDADGVARPVNAVYDIGAYEFVAPVARRRLTMMGVG